MTYDPRAKGAKCDVCPLKGCAVVPTEIGASVDPLNARGSVIAIIGDYPSEEESRTQRPFTGTTGEELDRTLHLAGVKRKDVITTNTILCRPPKGKLRDFMTIVNRENKQKEKNYRTAVEIAKQEGRELPPKPDLTPSPIDCCKPRLQEELKHITNFITMGDVSTKAITGSDASILSIRGGFMDLQNPVRRVMPTVHPSFALKQPRFKHVFRNDVFKGLRWFRGVAKWNPPELIWHPSAQQIRDFLQERKGRILAYDLETDGIEPLTARIWCLAIGDDKKALAIDILSKNGITRFYSPDEEVEIIATLKEYFEDPKEIKYGWNIVTYDNAVLQHYWNINIVNYLDGILMHKSAESEMPHGLGYVGSLYTEVHAWKVDRNGNKLAFGAETDEDLLKYCATDVAVTYSVLAPVMAQVKLRDQLGVYKFDQRVQEVCRSMHEIGMYVDQNKRLYYEKKMIKRRQQLLQLIREGVGSAKFNPGSTFQVRDLLFEKWQIEIPLHDKDRLTGAGDPSTSDLVLRTVLTDRSVPKEQRELIKLIRYYRKIQKTLGTYVTKLRYTDVEIESDLNWDDEDEDFEDRALRDQYGIKKRGIVNPHTNRMHPGWSSLPPVTGRLSSSKPMNAMNYPKQLRSMITCQPGHVLVGADSEQIEVRVAAAWWQIEKYLLAFKEGKDVHSMSTYMIFGEAFCKAAGIEEKYFLGPGKLVGRDYNEHGTFIGKGQSANLRKLGKATMLACLKFDTLIAVLDQRRLVAISQLQPGDWVWAWSLARKRYEPTRVVKAWCTGVRECITIKLSKGNTKSVTSEVTLTPDHPMLSRDGTFKNAELMQSDDRLMPFFRDDSTRSIMSPFNDERRVAESRVVCGLYSPDSSVHVHHKDHTELNNHPDNLDVLTPKAHQNKHSAAQKETRLAHNSIWRQAMADEDNRLARARNMKKKWETIKQNDPTYRTGFKESVLDSFIDFIGVYSDEAIAKKAGCSRALVGLYRKARNIAPPPCQRGGLRFLLLNDPVWRRFMLTNSNEVVAAEVNECFGTTYTRQAVNAIRKTVGRSDVKSTKLRGSLLDKYKEEIGHVLDSEIAMKAGVNRTTVRRYRESRGIPEYWNENVVKPENHRVVSTEAAGVFEVWDLEVEHEDHNFALGCGVFVHNSQYMAGIPQVHKMIQATEVPAKGPDGKDAEDGTTELPYALMPLTEVREMHEKWLAGAPEYRAGWERDINMFKKQGYLREPVNGRRRDFLDSLHGSADDLAANEIVNFSVQSAAAALISTSMLQVYEQIPKNKWGPGTGIINQCHDHIVIECPESEADWVRGVLEEAMNNSHPALPGVKFAATAEVGKSWDKV